jgi:hypothetical protein
VVKEAVPPQGKIDPTDEGTILHIGAAEASFDWLAEEEEQRIKRSLQGFTSPTPALSLTTTGHRSTISCDPPITVSSEFCVMKQEDEDAAVEWLNGYKENQAVVTNEMNDESQGPPGNKADTIKHEMVEGQFYSLDKNGLISCYIQTETPMFERELGPDSGHNGLDPTQAEATTVQEEEMDGLSAQHTA